MFLLIALFAILTSTPAIAKTGADVVPADAFGYVQLSDIYQVVEAVNKSPEWKELSQIKKVQTALMQMNQIVPVVQMITGMTWEEFVKIFGRQITFTLLGISEKPNIALIFEVSESKQLAEDALDQFLILMNAGAESNAAPETHEYSGVTFKTLSFKDGNTLQYGFLGPFMVLALNDGFKPLVDVYQGDAPAIATTPEFQDLMKKVEPSGTAYAYVNLFRTIPAIRAAEAAKKGEAVQPPKDEMEAAILNTPQALAVRLNLLGDTHEAYVRLRPQGPAMVFAPLLLREHPRLASIDFLPAINGAFIGLQLGNPVETWTQLTGLAAMMGHNLNEMMNGIEAKLGFNLKDDIFDALTGEIGVGISLPAGEVKLKERPIDFAKFQPVFAVGVKDRHKFESIPAIVAPLVQIDRFASSAEKSEGIRRGILTIDALAPGVALAPWYTFAGGLFVASTSRAQLEAIVTQLENPSPTVTEMPSASPWLLGYMNVGNIAQFLVQQNLGDNLKLPEHAVAKLPNISPIQIAYGAEPEGVKLTLTTAPGQTWISSLLSALMVAVYADGTD